MDVTRLGLMLLRNTNSLAKLVDECHDQGAEVDTSPRTKLSSPVNFHILEWSRGMLITYLHMPGI